MAGPAFPTLDQAIRRLKIKGALPRLLPSSHLRDARDLENVLSQLELPVWSCKVFKGEQLVYLFYGGVFYRRSGVPTNRAAVLPVAFVFRPRIIDYVERLFPFDTGAAHKGKYGDPWNEKLSPFKTRFRIAAGADSDAPAKMVHHFFGTNHDYLFGPARNGARNCAEPCKVLHAFLAAKQPAGIDQRYRRIEAHCSVPVPLEHLIWVGYPKVYETQVQQLVKKLASPALLCFDYEAYPLAPPDEIAAILQHEAHKAVVQEYM